MNNPGPGASAGSGPGAGGSVPAGVWAMGFASLFMDMSSELIHSLLPLFMVSVLGTSMITVGMIEGIAEASSSLVKVFSGALSDRLGRRKWLMVSGYGLAALSKPVFALAGSIGWVMGARFVDRIGKGIRGAPRDALIADLTPASLRGAAYGLRQGLDSLGALAGPALALALMAAFAGNLRLAMAFAILPALVSVILLLVFVHDPAPAARAVPPPRWSMKAVSCLPWQFWVTVLLGSLITAARFSEAFLILRAHDIGLAIGLVPLVMVAMNASYAALAAPAGRLADRICARWLMVPGLVVLVLADLMLADAEGMMLVLLGAATWGVHMALTQGLLSKLVADHAPLEQRGTAFGLFNLATGIATLFASILAGLLWQHWGPGATFLAGAGFAASAALGVLLMPRGRAGMPDDRAGAT